VPLPLIYRRAMTLFSFAPPPGAISRLILKNGGSAMKSTAPGYENKKMLLAA
jgi:hypothetical protein